ncbi:MAG: hypothetical protein JWP66_1434 [Naasia sp.]|nr:hypothetical protein [Naasia sp.]
MPLDLNAPADLDGLLARAGTDADRSPTAPPGAVGQMLLATGALIVLFGGIVATTLALSPVLAGGVSLGRAVLPELLGSP